MIHVGIKVCHFEFARSPRVASLVLTHKCILHVFGICLLQRHGIFPVLIRPCISRFFEYGWRRTNDGAPFCTSISPSDGWSGTAFLLGFLITWWSPCVTIMHFGRGSVQKILVLSSLYLRLPRTPGYRNTNGTRRC